MITDADVRRPAADVLAQALGTFPPHTAQALRRLGHLKRWQEGENILHNGVIAGSVLILLSGRVRMVASTFEGDEVLLRWFVPGEFVGVASVLGQVPFPTDAVASGTVEAVQIDASELCRHLMTDAEGALVFARKVSHLAAELVGLLVAFTSGRLEKRIVSLLARLVAHQPLAQAGEEVRLTLSQQDVAFAVGGSRQRVSLELRKLEETGFIKLGYRHIMVLRPLSGLLPGSG
ncbi:MAG: Crp/Fnr family transcriptional regulator [Pseudomonadota bacterium]